LPFSHYAISFLTDDIIRLRYVEIDGQLRKVMVVIKMRGGNHSKDIRDMSSPTKGSWLSIPGAQIIQLDNRYSSANRTAQGAGK